MSCWTTITLTLEEGFFRDRGKALLSGGLFPLG